MAEGLRLQHFGGVGEFLRGFELAFGVNDLCAALAFGFRLLGDGALHLFGDVHLLHFDFADLNAPRLGVLIKNDLQFCR